MAKDETEYSLFDGKHIDQETFNTMMRGQDLERLNEGEIDVFGQPQPVKFGQPVRSRRNPIKGGK